MLDTEWLPCMCSKAASKMRIFRKGNKPGEARRHATEDVGCPQETQNLGSPSTTDLSYCNLPSVSGGVGLLQKFNMEVDQHLQTSEKLDDRDQCRETLTLTIICLCQGTQITLSSAVFVVVKDFRAPLRRPHEFCCHS